MLQVAVLIVVNVLEYVHEGDEGDEKEKKRDDEDNDEIYGDYQAGADMETKPAMLRFEENDPETTIVYDRSKDGGNE